MQKVSIRFYNLLSQSIRQKESYQQIYQQNNLKEGKMRLSVQQSSIITKQDDNISTSGSEYFQQRWKQSQINNNCNSKSVSKMGLKTPRQSVNNNNNNKIQIGLVYSPPQVSKLNNNRNNKQNLNNYIQQQHPHQNKLIQTNKSNPFIQSSSNHCPTTTRRDIRKDQYNDRSKVKSFYYNEYADDSNTIKANNNKINNDEYNNSKIDYYKFIQPVTNNTHINPNTYNNNNIYNNNKSTNNNKQQPISPNEPHKLLQHIHFTIKHQSNLINVFKQFSSLQKQKVNQKINNMLREVENMLEQVKSKIYKVIDDKYLLFIQSMNSVKNMAQLMWKNKTHHNNNQPIRINHTITNNNNKHNSKSIHNNNNRHNSKSIHTSSYKKFSQCDNRSPQMNSKLLQQLHQQDIKLQQYLNTNKQYFHNQYQCSQQYQANNNIKIDKNKLLQTMYSQSIKIAMMINQYSNILYEKLSCNKQSNKQVQRLYYWLNSRNDINVNNSTDDNDYIYQSIPQVIQSYFSQLTSTIHSVKECINGKFLQS